MSFGMKAFSESGDEILHMSEMFSLDLIEASSTPRSRSYSLPPGASIIVIPVYGNPEQPSLALSSGANFVSWEYDPQSGDYQILVMCKMR